MKISVIVSTYNGAEYIVEQLDSVKNQTRKADEVLISDDVSSDNTVEIVNKYIADNGLQDTWKCSVNAQNKGFIKNFIDGAKRSSGDLIMFCDQDDIWEPEKTSVLENALIENNASAVYCLMSTIDSNGEFVKDKQSRFKKVKSKGPVTKVSLEARLNCGRSSGLCLLLKRSLLDDIETISEKYGIPHDLPVGLIASVNDSYYQINQSLVRHRVHQKNVSQFETSIVGSSANYKRQIESRLFKISELKAVTELYKDKLSDSQLKMAQEAISIHENCLAALNEHKIGKLVSSLFKSNRMVNKYLALRNILAIIRK